jgi:hypothetical protein
MWGPSNASIEEKIPSRHRGITPRVFEQLFARIQEEEYKMLKSNYIISVVVHSWRYIMSKSQICWNLHKEIFRLEKTQKMGCMWKILQRNMLPAWMM